MLRRNDLSREKAAKLAVGDLHLQIAVAADLLQKVKSFRKNIVHEYISV